MNVTKAVIELRGRLIESINASGLPPVVVGLVLDGVRNEIEKIVAMELGKEEADDGRNAEDADRTGE